MKLLDNEFANEIEIAIQKRQQQEYKLIGSYVPKIDGYTIFQYNKETKEFSVAEFRQSDTYVIGGNNGRKLDVKKGCVYIEALNEKNALKKLKRGDVIFTN